jgi:hypothetical protein
MRSQRNQPQASIPRLNESITNPIQSHQINESRPNFKPKIAQAPIQTCRKLWMIKKIILGITGIFALIFIAAFTAFFFTSLPFKAIGSLLNANGVHTENITGSLNSGITVDKLSFSNEFLDAELVDAKFLWSNMWMTWIKGIIAIELLETTSATIVVKKHKSSVTKKFAANKDQDAEQSSFGSDAKLHNLSKAPKGLGEFRIDKIHLRNVLIKDATLQKELNISEFVVDSLKAKNNHFSLKNISLDSNVSDLKVDEIKLTNDSLVMTSPIRGLIKTALFQELLKSDVAVEFVATMTPETPPSGELKLFENKILIQANKEFVNLEFKNFSPQDFFNSFIPISEISMKATQAPLISLMMGMAPMLGSVRIGHAVFDFNNPQSIDTGTAQHDGQNYQLKTNFLALIASIEKANPVLELTGPSPSLAVNFAKIYFNKKPEQLSEAEMDLWLKSSAYFVSNNTSNNKSR